MHRHGGAGSWFSVPYIICMSTVPKQILNKLEQHEISLYPMHLNREQRHRRKRMIKRGQYSRQHSLRGKTLPQSGVWNSHPSHTAQLQLYYGNGTVLCKGVDPTSAMQNADVVLIHSSLHDYPLATNLHQANPSSLSGSHQDAGFGHQIRLHTGSLPQVGYTTAA